MSIISNELIGSRTISRSGDSFTASRTFLVYDDDSNLSLSSTDAINYSGGVSFSDSHPEISSIFANGFSITPTGERRYTYTVVWSYAKPEEPTDAGGDDDEHDGEDDNTDVDPDDDGGELDPPTGGEEEQGNDGEVGDEGTDDGTDDSGDGGGRTFNGVSITTGISLVDGFVAGASIPSGGTEPAGKITSGTVVHEGGEAVTIPVPTAEISLSETVNGAYFYLNDVQYKAGKRNSGDFMGFNTGSVVFKGMSVQRQEYDKWDVSYTFAWDAWSHLRQVPKRSDNGDIDPNADGTLDIFFKQPFPSTTSFSFAP